MAKTNAAFVVSLVDSITLRSDGLGASEVLSRVVTIDNVDAVVSGSEFDP